MTGFRSDMTIIDDPIKDMVEAQSETVREPVSYTHLDVYKRQVVQFAGIFDYGEGSLWLPVAAVIGVVILVVNRPRRH